MIANFHFVFHLRDQTLMMKVRKKVPFMEEKHPVQALVWGIVDLVVACVGLLFIIPEIVLPIVYTAMKAGGQVPEADLRTVATTFFVIVVVFGVIVFFMIFRGEIVKDVVGGVPAKDKR